MLDETPILAPHIEDTIRAIAKLHDDHRLEAGSLQQLAAQFGRPQFIAVLPTRNRVPFSAQMHERLLLGTETIPEPPSASRQARDYDAGSGLSARTAVPISAKVSASPSLS